MSTTPLDVFWVKNTAGDYIDLLRLNRVSITFHKDAAMRKQVRELYELVSVSDSSNNTINRKIVGLIYDLCQRNGFRGITEYDIDQSFPEQKQAPDGFGFTTSAPQAPAAPEPAPAPVKKPTTRRTTSKKK
jgi:hypothetical protein